ncbi:SDR family NAD(P)-dependent oxidoreductase [Romeria aff. gracilis LEGE 07310]|uniref:SDR family NAD(P)-dependent oxidoreductase n=1 Tax=Vasconcelosia minhoensis LEGE 07310 TaxID=915328 RepID=A0A8J7DLR2_9CYAN|nr:SDR family NAD(P)-dependent oxidoreductase [Romeria gracilis]MBE9077496.1 SDR family NAD(P)-dependent oxidoreductase [Romeria aff. gracilis LEGE 07310]
MTQPARRPTALVTGASSGIGRAIALRLAQEGYDLAICARRQDRLDELSQTLKQHGDVLAQPVDLRDEGQILDFFSAIKTRWGYLDVLVNNAGLGHNQPLLNGSTEGWREMLDVNVLALCICTRETVQLMQANGDSGHIVHISSMSGHRVPSLSGLYSATKFAVRSLTEGLRRELRAADSNIRVSSISPGYVETEFAEKYHQSAEKAQETYSRFPVLQPQDIANAVSYVLSQPSYVQVHDILVRPTGQET